ncbi:PREDICTED: vinorine synthase-like [Nicotiana attenuata]|uniref:vinorine synthase-like n=1 Tax=Nicotiana attenuata TaxID=49451 RepID=UPI0009048680|nr:PREDICTED: vinorine synthase-like [Nicotiana attenuata]
MELISQEFIRPVSPTPNHLKSYDYSLHDQFSPTNYIPILLYYPPPQLGEDNQNPNAINSTRLKQLKKSLSQVLAHYYPLAGRLGKNNTSVDCNDEGVPFIEAFVHNQRLEDILMRMVIGISATHKIFDASSVLTFLTDWSALARQDNPNFVLTQLVPIATLVPSSTEVPPVPDGEAVISREPCRTNIYVFNSSSIANLKIKGSSENIPIPSRVEVVTSILWKCLTANSKKPSFLTHVVNLRKRVDPPLHAHHIGNFVWLLLASKHESEEDIASMVVSIRKGLFELDNNYVKRLKGDKAVETIRDGISLLISGIKDVDFNQFTSWCGYTFYDVDFGWGKPILFCTIEPKLKNTTILLDTKDGGVEAWVTLGEEDMKMFEKNKELLNYATLKASHPT